MGGEGFEPSKAVPTDLQSAPFGHSGIRPYNHYTLFLINYTWNGAYRVRTCDPLLVRQMLSQLSYDPITTQKRLELSTSAVTGRRSNQLSHRALFKGISCTCKTTYKFKSLLHPFFLTLSYLLGYALDRLVTVSSMHYCTSTSALSTLSSSRGLTTCVGISHLEGGFTLRCLQRLSLPDLATLPCSWRNNRYTSGQSSPVLSY